MLAGVFRDRRCRLPTSVRSPASLSVNRARRFRAQIRLRSRDEGVAVRHAHVGQCRVAQFVSLVDDPVHCEQAGDSCVHVLRRQCRCPFAAPRRLAGSRGPKLRRAPASGRPQCRIPAHARRRNSTKRGRGGMPRVPRRPCSRSDPVYPLVCTTHPSLFTRRDLMPLLWQAELRPRAAIRSRTVGSWNPCASKARAGGHARYRPSAKGSEIVQRREAGEAPAIRRRTRSRQRPAKPPLARCFPCWTKSGRESRKSPSRRACAFPMGR